MQNKYVLFFSGWGQCVEADMIPSLFGQQFDCSTKTSSNMVMRQRHTVSNKNNHNNELYLYCTLYLSNLRVSVCDRVSLVTRYHTHADYHGTHTSKASMGSSKASMGSPRAKTVHQARNTSSWFPTKWGDPIPVFSASVLLHGTCPPFSPRRTQSSNDYLLSDDTRCSST